MVQSLANQSFEIKLKCVEDDENEVGEISRFMYVPGWLSVSVKTTEIFQLKDGSTTFRMLNYPELDPQNASAVQNQERAKVIAKADTDTARHRPAIAVATDQLFVIGGGYSQPDTYRRLATVSSYNLTTDTWEGCQPQLIQAREMASACVLQGTVYVFCGWND